MSTPLKLDEKERLLLQNIMLRMAYENERIKNYNINIQISELEINKLKSQLQKWNNKFNKKLNKLGLNITDVDIDSETGIVTHAVRTLMSASK